METLDRKTLLQHLKCFFYYLDQELKLGKYHEMFRIEKPYTYFADYMLWRKMFVFSEDVQKILKRNIEK